MKKNKGKNLQTLAVNIHPPHPPKNFVSDTESQKKFSQLSQKGHTADMAGSTEGRLKFKESRPVTE